MICKYYKFLNLISSVEAEGKTVKKIHILNYGDAAAVEYTDDTFSLLSIEDDTIKEVSGVVGSVMKDIIVSKLPNTKFSEVKL